MQTFHIIFSKPWWFTALIPTLWVIYKYVYQSEVSSQWDKICDPLLLPHVVENSTATNSISRTLWALLASLLLIVALAGPSWKSKKVPALKNQSALVIALDLSQSMNASDIKPSRLQRAKFKIEDLLNKRQDGLTGLVVYAGDAFSVSPLTADTKTIKAQLPVLQTSIMPAQGSHAELAINSAIELFKQAGSLKGDILLVSDEVNATQAVLAAKKALSQGFNVSILSVGTKQGAPIPQGRSFIRNNQNDIVLAKINPSEMKDVTRYGNGLYVAMTNDNQDINQLNERFDGQVDAIQKVNNTMSKGVDKNDTLKIDSRVQEGHWFVLLALPFLLPLFRRAKKAFTTSAFSLLLILPFIQTQSVKAAEWQDTFLNQNQRAEKYFDQGLHEKSANLFDDPKWKQAAHYQSGKFEQALQDLNNATSSDDWYNRGNILAKLNKLDEAISAYDQSIKINPKNQDAIYNRELLKKEKEKKEKEQQKNKDQQNKDQQNKDQQNKDQQNKNQQNKNQQNKNQQNKDQQNKGQQNKNQQNKNEQNKEQQNKNQKKQNGQAQSANKDKKKDKNEKKENKNQASSENQEKDLEKDKSNNQALAPDSDTQQAKDEQSKQTGHTSSMLPPDEAEEAKKQWLRRIPDDPALLWKRKFYYQYKQRARQTKNDGEKKW